MLDPTTDHALFIQVKLQFRPQHKWTAATSRKKEAELVPRKIAANFVRSEPALESRSS